VINKKIFKPILILFYLTISNQVKTLKEIWLIIIGLIVIVLVLNGGLDGFNDYGFSDGLKSISSDYDIGGEIGVVSQRYYEDGFAPESFERKVTKTASSSVEVKRGEFKSSSDSLKDYILDAEGILISENVNSIGEGMNKRMTSYYSVRVSEDKYESFILDVKSLGEVESFNENVEDIIGDYIDLSYRIEFEKNRLEKYEGLFDEADSIGEKLSLTDRIFQQERTIKYLEDALDRKDLKIEYVSVNINLNEKSSGFVGVSIVTFSRIVKSFVDSFNQLVLLVVWIIPWVLLIFLGKIVWKFFKR